MDGQDWKNEFKVKYKEFSSDAKEAAQGWGCCAVGCRLQGELDDYASMRGISMKKLLTPKAYRLGIIFNEHVSSNNVEKAEKTYDQIQALDNIIRIEGKTYYPWDAYI